MNLPLGLLAEIEAAASECAAITVPARHDDLAPLAGRHLAM